MHKKNKKRPYILGLIIFILLSVFIYKTSSVYTFMFHLMFDRGVTLKQTNSNINILLLGIGGGYHEGPNLTDTIILATVNQKDKKIILTSIPRDLWISDLTQSSKKINTAYAYGESVRKGGGLMLSKAVAAKVTGQQIDYGLRIDFSGFVKAVDTIGGLDVNIDNTFDDFAYPISGKENDSCGYTDSDIKEFIATVSAEKEIQDKFSCRYKHLHFDQGPTRMDGEVALEYVRSRHALGTEGTDFSRSKRQEKIINAFKDKIMSAQTLTNPAKILSLYGILKNSIDTDIKQEEMDDFIRLAQKLKGASLSSAIIDAGDEEAKRLGFLINPPITEEYNFEWVLIPKVGKGNFSEIHSYILCQINSHNCKVNK